MDTLDGGGTVNMAAAETGLRDAAMRDAAAMFASVASAMSPPVPTCPKCGSAMESGGRHGKDVVSLAGSCTVQRSYYSCSTGCGEHAVPLDVLLGIESTSYTPALRAGVSALAAEGSFEWSSEVLLQLSGIGISPKQIQRIAEGEGKAIEHRRAALRNAVWDGTVVPATDAGRPDADTTLYIECDGTGIPMARSELFGRQGKGDDGVARTREAKLGCVFTQRAFDKDGSPVRDKGSTSYFGAIEMAENFGKRLWEEAMIRGLDLHGRVVIIGDGARWIWNIADRSFPGALQVVDLFHAKEHVFDLARLAIPGDASKVQAQAALLGLLEEGDIEGLAIAARGFAKGNPETEEAVERELGYFLDNIERMRYKKFRAAGLFVGSGVIEAGCKSVIGKRLKQSGMFWSVDGANAIIALRCSEKSGRSVKEYLTLRDAA
jgi:hypothetical protein